MDSYVYDTVNRPALEVVEDHTHFGVREVHGQITVENPTGVRVDLGPSPVATDVAVIPAKQ